MIVFNLGVAVLLVGLFPIASQVLGLLSGEVFGSGLRKISPIYVHLLNLMITYAPAYIVAALFSNYSALRSRLPKTPPGRGWITLGLILTLLYIVTRLFASTIEGGGAGFVVQQFGPYVLIPARALIVVGLVQVLLAALPRLTRRSTRTATGGASPPPEAAG